jgi:hypothetical protein
MINGTTICEDVLLETAINGAIEGYDSPAKYHEGDKIDLIGIPGIDINWMNDPLTSVHKNGEGAISQEPRSKYHWRCKRGGVICRTIGEEQVGRPRQVVAP